MEPIKFTLCPDCVACPEIEITDEDVRIGEDANTAGCPIPNGIGSSPSSSAATFTKSSRSKL